MSQSLQSATSNIQNQNLFHQKHRQHFIPGPFTQMLCQPFPEPRLSSSQSQNKRPGPGSSHSKFSSYGNIESNLFTNKTYI